MPAPGTLSEYGAITTLVLKHARDAFGTPERAAAEWRTLNFTGPPDIGRAIDEYDAFVDLLRRVEPELLFLPAAEDAGLDSIYVRDAAVVGPRGAILCSMGKSAREAEPRAQAEAYARWGLPVAGAIVPPGRLEGGDVIWLDDQTAVVGRSYRTNDEGIRQLRALLDDAVTLVTVPLPHWRGPQDVFHLMSVVSPVDGDLAVVYSPLMPVPLRELLLERGHRLVEVPDAEFEVMGTNVLAIAPRRCVMLDTAPLTRRRLEAAGAEVRVYAGREISQKGGGGPTCLTRPLVRTNAIESWSP